MHEHDETGTDVSDDETHDKLTTMGRRSVLRTLGLGAVGTSLSSSPGVTGLASATTSNPALSLVPTDETTTVATQSGVWADPATWDQGVPADGGRAHVPEGVTVTLDHEDDARLEWVRVDGTLRFDPGADTHLQVETLITSGGSRLEIGTEATPIDPDRTARLTFVDRGPIDEDDDPRRIGKGLVTMGTVEIHGAERTNWTSLDQHATVGDDEISLSDPPTGWQPGDQLVLPAQKPAYVWDTDPAYQARDPNSPDELDGEIKEDTVHDEEVTIASIDGRTVHLEETLEHDHVPPRASLDSYVLNLTRNVRFDSENTDPLRRGHVMFMNQDVDVRYLGTYGLGRTEKRRPITNPNGDGEGVDIPDGPPNPKARYALHFHRTGYDPDTDPGRIEGCAVWGSPGWGIVNHESHADIVDSVTYDVVGAGFVAENGLEIGSFERNFALRSRGTAEPAKIRAGDNRFEGRGYADDYGHAGHGFWFQGPGVAVEDNVAAGHRSHAFVFWSLLILDLDLPDTEHVEHGRVHNTGVPVFPVENTAEQPHAELTAENTEDGKISPAKARLRLCRNNEAFASGGGLLIADHRWDPDMVCTFFNEFSVVDSFLGYSFAFYNSGGGKESGKHSAGIAFQKASEVIVTNATLYSGHDRGFKTKGVYQKHKNGSGVVLDSTVEGFDAGITTSNRQLQIVRGCTLNNDRDVVARVEAVGPHHPIQMSDLTLDGGGIELVHQLNQFNYKWSRELRVFRPVNITLDGRRLYTGLQNPDVVPWPTEEDQDGGGNEMPLYGEELDLLLLTGEDKYVPFTDFVGMTNRQIKNEHGIEMQGELVPEGATEASDVYTRQVNGASDSDGGTLPRTLPAYFEPTGADRDGEDLRIDEGQAEVATNYEEASSPSTAGGRFLECTATSGRSSPPDSPDVTYTTTVSGGEYELWTRTFADDGDPWNLWARVDGGAWHPFMKDPSHNHAPLGWKWVRLNEPGSMNDYRGAGYGVSEGPQDTDLQTSGTPVTFDLSAGEHTIEFAYRRETAHLDRVMLTSRGTIPALGGRGSSIPALGGSFPALDPGEDTPDPDPADEPVSHYPFDGDTPTDAVGDNDGTIGGDVRTGAAGKIDEAFDFDGDGDYVHVPNLEVAYDGSADWTASLWINPDTLPTESDRDASHLWHPRGQNDLWVQVDENDNVELGTWDGDSVDELVSGVTVAAGEWTHVCVVSDTSADDQYRIFLDGTEEASGNLTAPVSKSDTNVIGGQHSGPFTRHYFDGRIDDVRIYDRALSDTEVGGLYNDTPDPDPADEPVSHYPFDGDTPTDAVGDNDGTIGGDVRTGAAGKIDEAFDFDGDGDYVHVPNLEVAYDGSADWTASLWINPDTLPTESDRDASHLWHPRGQNDLWVQVDENDNVELGTWDGDSVDELVSGVTVAAGEWTHVCVVSDTSADDQYRIFLDGTEEASGNLTAPVSKSDTNVIGGQHSGQFARHYFDGRIDDVRIYDRALSDAEVAGLSESASEP
jgi:hypothetical protein